MRNCLKSINHVVCSAAILVLTHTLQAQLSVSTIPHTQELVKDVLMGPGVEIANITYTGTADSKGAFVNRNTSMALSKGIVLSTGYVKYLPGPNKSQKFSGMMDGYGDKDLHMLAKQNTYDAAVLSFQFTCTSDMVRFEYVFGSDEYDEYVGSHFNDVFAFILKDLETGEVSNLAIIPGTSDPISINTINDSRHSAFYIDNRKHDTTLSEFTIELDGFTQPLLAFSKVVPGRSYLLKIAISDAGDSQLDSGVFIKAKSFQSQQEFVFRAETEAYFKAFKSKQYSSPSNPKIVEQVLKNPPADLEADSSSIARVPAKPLPSKSEPKTEHEPTNDAPQLTLFFDYDTDTLSSDWNEDIADWITALGNQRTRARFVIVGHTDQRGSTAYNEALGLRRAKFIKNELLNLAILPAQITTLSQGASAPADNRATEAAFAKNRRVILRAELP